MKTRIALMAMFVLVVFSGCTPPDPRSVTHTSMGNLEVGMSPIDAQIATLATPEPVFDFEVEGKPWTAAYFLHHAGQSMSRYLAVFDETGLRYWGFLHEFERQQNEEIIAAARVAEKKYLEWLRAQPPARLK